MSKIKKLAKSIKESISGIFSSSSVPKEVVDRMEESIDGNKLENIINEELSNPDKPSKEKIDSAYEKVTNYISNKIDRIEGSKGVRAITRVKAKLVSEAGAIKDKLLNILGLDSNKEKDNAQEKSTEKAPESGKDNAQKKGAEKASESGEKPGKPLTRAQSFREKISSPPQTTNSSKGSTRRF